METKLENIQLLLHFKNQQVILKFYENDELIQREGIEFESVSIIGSQSQFKKGDKIQYSLQLNNYFSLENSVLKVDLYFP
ncbi:hypothetical protein BGM26_04885 [Bacillus sp. FJAT-29790]|uniref:hypothetical protein n=1 Tax=Bacillus sp. FJAT-29790 TaxID=1895002 RepID=UPI001C22E2F2|nr:hypothetical protein [Bacillus sp. FJAT-29790]MBU8878322.1 hypothetical protein [Bacillus sp. FJAT-29790]